MSTLSLRDPDDEEQLVRILASYRARTGRKIAVVFDAGAGLGLLEKRRYAGVEVVFAPDRSSADRVISNRVRRSRNPSEWLVVTSDRQLAEAVARQGARVRDAEGFAAELERQPEETMGRRDGPLSPEEVEAWLSLFEDRD
jgi:predicted RNA-binding protein with PIN domain